MKQISLIVPIYNCRSVLGYCLDSICAQTINKDLIEVLLVDDASTDGSLALCREYEEKFDYIKVIALQKNSGQSIARNTAVELAEGEYIFFADSDDWLGPDCLRRLLAYAEDNHTDMIVGRVIVVDRGKKRGRVAWCRENTREYCNGDFENNWDYYATMGPWGRLIKKDFLKSFHIEFPSDIYMFEDIYWNMQILHHASNVCMINDYDYYFLRRDTGIASMTTNDKTINKSMMPENIYHAVDKIASLAEEYGWGDDHPIWVRVFRSAVKDGIVFTKNSALIDSVTYPDFGRYYTDLIWQRVKSHYSPHVRQLIGIELVCRYDAMAAGHDYDYEDDSIRYFALTKYGKAKASSLLKESGLKGTLLPSFMSKEGVLRLVGGQAESYTFSSSFLVKDGTLGGDYFIALRVTDEFTVEMQIHCGSETHSAVATMVPSVWGEEYQESGVWSVCTDLSSDDIDTITFHIKAGDVEAATGTVTHWDGMLGRPIIVNPTKEKLKTTTKQLKETKAALKETRGQLKETKTKLKETKTKLKDSKDTISKMKSSYSWKVTKPLRQIRSMTKEK